MSNNAQQQEASVPSAMDFFNPDDRILIRISNCLKKADMKQACGFWPTGTLVRVLDQNHCIRFIEYQEETTMKERAKRARATHAHCGNFDWTVEKIFDKFSTSGRWNWDMLSSGERVDWWKRYSNILDGDRFLLLGHVEFPWSQMGFSTTRNYVSTGPLEYRCIQVWMPLGLNRNDPLAKPIAFNFFRHNVVVEMVGSGEKETTLGAKKKDSKLMEGLSFEIVDRTCLKYQPDKVKHEVAKLLGWNQKTECVAWGNEGQ